MSEPRSGWRKRARRADRSGLDPALEAAVNAAYERGTPISEADARRAAEAGSRPGMTVYGIGLGNRGAFTEAQKWLVRAIELGDAMAAVALGTMHMDLGQFDRADQCFRLAATSGHPAARRGLQELAARRAKRGSLPPVSEPAGPGPHRWRLQPTRGPQRPATTVTAGERGRRLLTGTGEREGLAGLSAAFTPVLVLGPGACASARRASSASGPSSPSAA